MVKDNLAWMGKDLRKMAEQEKKEVQKTYKNKVVFLRRSKAGNHLFVYDSREDLVSGGTLIMNVSEVEDLIRGERDWLKVGILPPETDAEDSASE